MRRAAAIRIQNAGPIVEPVVTTPTTQTRRAERVWAIGDRVVFQPDCVEVAIPREEIGAFGTVRRVTDNQPVVVDSDSGNTWAVQPFCVMHWDDYRAVAVDDITADKVYDTITAMLAE